MADTIDFAPSLSGQPIKGTLLPAITDPAGLTIDGGGANITISGNDLTEIFSVNSGAKLTLNKLTVANGDPGINNNDGTVTVSNSTISGNSAGIVGGGGIRNSGTATLRNTIMANNPSGGNCGGSSPATDGGYNLDSGTTCGFGTNNNSLSDVDPMLGPLADNGGPTLTLALLEGSPAIDQGNSFGATTDQRGLPRPYDFDTITNATGGDGSDIGAYEYSECEGAVVNAVGTSGPDVLEGGEGADAVRALPGKDKILGMGGDDTICAGKGANTLVGGEGDDRLFGRGGKDRLNTTDGVRANDLADGGPGKGDVCKIDPQDKRVHCE